MTHVIGTVIPSQYIEWEGKHMILFLFSLVCRHCERPPCPGAPSTTPTHLPSLARTYSSSRTLRSP